MNNLNGYLQPLNAPVSQLRAISGFQNEMKGEIQVNRIKSAFINVDNFIAVSPIGTTTYTGTAFVNGTTLKTTTTLANSSAYPLIFYSRLMAIPTVSIYQGTAAVAANQIYPTRGSSIAFGNYRTYGGAIDYSTATKTSLSFIIDIENVAAAEQKVYVLTQWRYIYNYGAGAST